MKGASLEADMREMMEMMKRKYGNTWKGELVFFDSPMWGCAFSNRSPSETGPLPVRSRFGFC